MSRNRRRQQPTNARPQPKNVEGMLTARTMFYREQLEIILNGMFELKAPDDWDRDYFLYNIIHEGSICIARTPAGILPLRTSYSGINYMNRPTMCVISVPVFPEMELAIGEECEIVYLKRRGEGAGFYNFNNMLNVYSQKLASADACIDVNLMNSRVAYVVEAETKAQAETLEYAYSQITNGKPLVVLRKGSTGKTIDSEGIKVFFNSVKNNYIADLVQDSKRTIMNEFLTMIGINNANTDKKERLITGEVDSNNDELAINVYTFNENLKTCNKKVNNLYPELDYDLKLKFDMSNKQKGAFNAVMGASSNVGGRTPKPRIY